MKVWVLVLLVASVCAKHEIYQGWKSYYVGPSTQEQFKALRLMTEEFHVDFLSHPTLGREGVALVSPPYQAGFIKTLEENNIAYRVHAEDVKAALDIDDEKIENRRKESLARNGGREIPYDNYQEIEVINAYLEDIAARYPSTVTLVTPAYSFEGRPLYYLKISSNLTDNTKPLIIIDGGIHAREWISPPTTTWAIHKLVENVTEPDLLEQFDWIIMPVVNPDGYKFTFSTTRFWRKTRSTDQHASGILCPGVDGNRNFNFEWNTVGTSNNPCSDIYAGSRAFSEIETRVVRDILQENLPRTALYLTMHSYGSMILYGWGHDGSDPANVAYLQSVGIDMAVAIDAMSLSNFPNYIVGNSAQVLFYAAAGASEDYAHSIGVPLSYTYELPGLAGGFEGFNLDPIYIEQVCRETWAGIVVGARKAGELFEGPINPY